MNLLVLNYEYPPIGGGAGEITKNISENIALLGHQVTVVTAWYKGLEEDGKMNGVRVIRLKSKRKTPYHSNVFEMVSWIKKSKLFLSDFCQKEKFDCCFANFAIPGGVTAFYLKKKFGIPYTVISHGHDIPWLFKKEMFFYHLLTYFTIKKICQASSFNFIQTPAMKKNIDAFLSLAHSDKNRLIPNGIDLKQFAPDKSKRSEKIRILFCGRMVPQKDPLTFLKAIKKVYKNGPSDFEVTVAGDGPLRITMEHYVNENALNGVVKFTGWITRDVLLSEYQKSQIFVQSSKYEAMSMAVMEALACGCFVLCTRVGSNETIIHDGDNGYFFEKGRDDMLAEKISAAVMKFKEDKLRISSAESLMEWKDVAEKYLGCFEEILSH